MEKIDKVITFGLVYDVTPNYTDTFVLKPLNLFHFNRISIIIFFYIVAGICNSNIFQLTITHQHLMYEHGKS